MNEKNENSINKLKKRSIFHKIVNGFIGFFIGFFLLLLLILGFTQTSLFRGILREQVIKIVNSELNGNINIGRIDGTIFTSLLLNDVSLNMGQDTLLKAKLIEVRTSPLQIFYKKIFVRKVGIENAKISFLKDSTGKLNISKLFKPKEEDTSKSSFPFKIKLIELKLSNVDFSMQDESKKYNAGYSNILDLSDLRISGLNLSLSANADIDNKDFELYLNSFSCSSNISNLNIEQLKGDFLVNTKRVIVGNLELRTTRSNIGLSIKNEKLNIFGGITKDSINNTKTDILIDIKKFAFEDLSAIVPSLNYLHGDVEASLAASGNMKQVDISKLNVKYLDTKLSCTGYLKNLDEGNRMFISAGFTKSNIVSSNIPVLIDIVKIPVYKNMDNISIDTLKFEGEPLNFKSRLSASVNGSVLKSDIDIDLRPDNIIYAINFRTNDLNLEPIINIPTKLDLEGKINGSGTSTATINSNVELKANGSSIKNINIDSFSMTANASNQFVNFSLNTAVGQASLKLDGGVDLFDTDNPVYNFDLITRKLNLAEILKDTTLASNLNFDLSAKGKSFDIDRINTSMKFKLSQSAFMGYSLENTEIDVAVEDRENDERSLSISSPLGNISLTGRYSLKEIAGVAADDILLLKNQIFEKVNQSFPSLNLAVAKPSVQGEESSIQNYHSMDDSMYVNFQIELKDFSMFSKIFNAAQLDADGKLTGRYESNPDGVKFILLADINYFQYWNDKDVLFVTSLKGNMSVEDNFNTFTIKDMKSEINFSTERIFTGNDFTNLSFSASLNNNIMNIAAGGEMDTKFKGKLAGNADISGSTVKLNLDSLNLSYNKLKITNSEAINIDVFNNNYDIKKLILNTGTSQFSAWGLVALQGEQNLKMTLNNLSLKHILSSISDTVKNNQVDAKISLNSEIKGTFNLPVITGSMNINDLVFKEKNFGSLGCLVNYKDKNLNFDVNIIDTTVKSSAPRFSMTGNFPIDLAFAGVPKRILEDNSIKIKVLFNEFNLASLGSAVPKVSDIQGKVNADLSFEGTLNKLKKNGYLNVTDCSFFSEANYLAYNAGLKVSLAEDILSIDDLFVENRSLVKNKGVIRGSGKVIFDGYKINNAEVKMKGDLTVLTNESKEALPALYGELFIGTAEDAVFTYKNGKMFVWAPLEIKNADLVFPPFATGFRSYNEKFIYKYPVYFDSSKIGKKSNLEKVKEAITQAAQAKTATVSSSGNALFDYDISINIKNDAKVVFIVNKETNLKLTAELGGNFRYENYDGVLNTFGELKLLEGSTLEFIKNLDATGSLKFESDITNPYLNVVATYKSSYEPTISGASQTSGNTTSSSGNMEEATIKIKIATYLNELAKNLQNEDNLLVYTTAENYNNNSPDKTKKLLNAAVFFLTNKFDLSLFGTTSGAGGGIQNSLAGNIVGSVLNSYLGDAVKRFDISTVGNDTKFNLSGKFGTFKYTIGSSLNGIQDISKANVKIEKSIFDNLILRYEYKQNQIDNSKASNEAMMSEVGIKYRYEF